jgi:hypothetical protein
MSNNLFISYDLNSPNQDYNAVIEVIKSLGAWASVQKSLWYVKSDKSAEQAAEIVREKMDANDSLIVMDTNNNDAYWYNVSEEVGKHIQEHWNM